MTLSKKMIMYKNIREISLQRSVMQRIYGLGSIYLITSANDNSGSGRKNSGSLTFSSIFPGGIKLCDIKDSDEFYQKIKQIIGL